MTNVKVIAQNSLGETEESQQRQLVRLPVQVLNWTSPTYTHARAHAHTHAHRSIALSTTQYFIS